jgi:hypothetical protein
MDNPFKGMPKWGIYATAGGGILVVGYALYKHHASTGSWSPFSTSTTTSAGSAASIDPITGLAYSNDSATDPITGQTYLAEAQQYGSVAAAEASVSAYGTSTASGSGIPVNPASPIPAGSINTPVGTSVYTSNAAWAQAVQAGLEDVSGSTSYDGTDIGTALGAFLTQTPVTAAQAKVINVAIGEYGPPPSGNLQVIQAPVSVSSPPPSSGTGQVQVPEVAGQTAGAAHNAITAAGLKPADPDASRAMEPQDKVLSTTPAGGSVVNKGSTVTINAAPYVTVPSIRGKTAGEAHNTLVAAKLDPIAPANQKPSQKVTGSSPAAGAEVPAGTRVSIIT